MTRTGKCEVCRLRKVKCDERKPNCGACEKKGRLCRYGAQRLQQPKNTSGLAVQSARQAPMGSGLFQTMIRHTSGKQRPCFPPRSTSDNILVRWSQMIANKPFYKCPYNILEEVLTETPLIMGASPVVALTAKYMLDSHVAEKRMGSWDSEENIEKAHNSGAKAMRALRDVVVDKTKAVDQEIIVAVRLMFLAEEICRGFKASFYCMHLIAICEILRMRYIPGLYGCFAAASANYLEEFLVSMHTGCVSAFDNPLHCQSIDFGFTHQYVNLSTASKFLVDRIVPMPRLILLTRRLSTRPITSSSSRRSSRLAEAALKLAKDIYDYNAAQFVEGLLNQRMSIVATSPEFDPDLVPTSFAFDCVSTFMLATFGCVYRILISNVIQQLFRLRIATAADFNPSAIQAEEVRAAETLAMCSQFGLSRDFGPRLASVRLCQPNKMAYGSWKRLERRLQAGGGAADNNPLLIRAREMTKYHIRVSNRAIIGCSGANPRDDVFEDDFIETACQAFTQTTLRTPWEFETAAADNNDAVDADQPAPNAEFVGNATADGTGDGEEEDDAITMTPLGLDRSSTVLAFRECEPMPNPPFLDFLVSQGGTVRLQTG